MPYGHVAGDVRVFEYGVPRSAIHHGLGFGFELAIAEMRRRNQLWNRLVEIDHAYRDERALLVSPYPLPERVNGSRPRRQLLESVLDELHALDDRVRVSVNLACQDSGCWWGNYTDVKLSWLVARKRADGVKIHGFRGEGKITGFVAHGISVSRAAEGSMVRLAPGAREGDVLAHIRIGSQEREPVWLVLPARFHRPLPADGLIRSASAIRERVVDQWRWKLLITVERPVGLVLPWATLPGERRGRISLDLGWRKRPNGLRVAYWRGDAGREGELLLDDRYLARMRRCEELRSQRDLIRNAAQADLGAWLGQQVLPDWLREETRTLRQWRSPSRLGRLEAIWRRQRFEGDSGGYGVVAKWRRDDLPLWQEEGNLRDKALRDRREVYRRFAAATVARYAEIVIEDFDLSQVAVVKGMVPDERLPEVARWQRFIAGTYQLRLVLVNAAKREGVAVTKVPSAYTTAICSACGSLEKWNHAELRHRCDGCGVEWDQDSNASVNLLAL